MTEYRPLLFNQKPRVSDLIVDADLNMGAVYTIFLRNLQALAGDSIYLKDDAGTWRALVNSAGLYGLPRIFSDNINERSANLGITFGNKIVPCAPAAGTFLAASDQVERTHTGAGYTRQHKQFLITRAGTVRIRAAFKITLSHGGYVAVFKNGAVIADTETWLNNDPAVYVEYIWDRAFAINDVIDVRSLSATAGQSVWVDGVWIGSHGHNVGLMIQTLDAVT